MRPASIGEILPFRAAVQALTAMWLGQPPGLGYLISLGATTVLGALLATTPLVPLGLSGGPHDEVSVLSDGAFVRLSRADQALCCVVAVHQVGLVSVRWAARRWGGVEALGLLVYFAGGVDADYSDRYTVVSLVQDY